MRGHGGAVAVSEFTSFTDSDSRDNHFPIKKENYIFSNHFTQV